MKGARNDPTHAGRAFFELSGALSKRRGEPVTIANGFVYLSGMPPFDPETGEIKPAPFEQQCERVLAQLKACLETAGSSLSQVIKCNVYCVPGPTHFTTFNAVYDRYFPKDAPSRIFMFIHSWPGPFDLEIDCVAVAKSGA